MKVLIVGANGYLGARLFFDLKAKFDVVGTYNRNRFHDSFIQLDVTDKNQVSDVFRKIEPDIAIQAANYPSPRYAVNNEEVFTELNLMSTEHIRGAANDSGARVIFVSSFAALDPGNIYGELKLKSEEIIKDVEAGYLILRPSLILGYSPNTTNERPFNRVLKHMDEGTAAEFDTSWKFQPTYVGHISDVIEACIQTNIFNEVVHIFCPSIETQFSTARDILKPFGVEVKPIDKQRNWPIQERNEKELKDLGLPTCSYQDMIKKIHEEINSRDKFRYDRRS